MRLAVTAIGDLVAQMEAEERAGRVAVRAGLNAAATGLQTDWRKQVEGAGLGARLARTIRARTWPRMPSSNAASLVWTNAPRIIDANERGALIKARGGVFLAIPTEAAGRGGGPRRDARTGRFVGLTPESWEAATGITLRFVPLKQGIGMLVADNARMNTRGRAVLNRRKMRRDGIQTGSQTIPIFIMVAQVRLPKRLDLARDAERWAARVPGLVVSNWPRTAT